VAPPVASVGDAYDNALAESVIGLFKAEVVQRRGPWRGVDDVEYATLEWVAWFNQQRLPAAYEERVSRAQAAQPALAALN
jgi:putative transposase